MSRPGPRAVPAPDAGFTLIELLIVIALLGLASSAILGALYMGIQTVEDTSTRFVNANNRNFSTKYLIPDIQAWDASSTATASQSNMMPGANPMPCPTSPSDEFKVVYEEPGSHAVVPGGAPGRRVTRTYRVEDVAGECTLVRDSLVETLVFCPSGIAGEDETTCSVPTEPDPLPVPTTQRTELLAGLRQSDPVCIDYIEAGVDYSPSSDSDWCVTRPSTVYARPTLRLWIADSEDTPPGQYDYTVTASSRVGRVPS